tara:strand:- start:1376 stop:3280 length:1905 start_codon:yes stop_codon:yes gene_type:complete
MKIVYQDLLRFLSENPSKDSLSMKLFELGHEHELEGDIFDFEFTPNRGDCLSVMGLARDLKLFFGNNDSIPVSHDEIEELELDFQNLSPENCPKITFLELEIGDDISRYEPYLESYFSKIGNKKTNFFSDISNYISYELGQPTHCYDKDTINGKLKFEKIEGNKKFLTLLGSEINLTNENCVFTLDDEVINLAGVMGGDSTSCSKKTKTVIIECAFFNPESIIGKSIKYNLNSDAAHKFERGVDISLQEKTLRRFISVVEDHTAIKSKKIKTFSFMESTKSILEIDVKKINSILGSKINKDEYLNYLRHLDFEVNDVIEVPSHRHDISSQNDLAEEIARLIGYNNIPDKSIEIKLKQEKYTDIPKVSLIEAYLSENGFNQVINFPFSKKKDKKAITIDNPLDSNKNNLRLCLKDSLVENLLYNERRQKDSIRLFEISNIYSKENKLKHQKNLGIIVSGRCGNSPKNFSKKIDFDYLNNILNKSKSDEIFKIVEISRSDLDTKKKDKIFYVEIDINEIPNEFFLNKNMNKEPISFTRYVPISEYPSSIRDFSFLIEDKSLVDKVIKMLQEISDDDIKESFIFDFYEDMKNDNLKIGFRVIFQSSSKTLSDKEINKKIEKFIKPIISLGNVSIPGM